MKATGPEAATIDAVMTFAAALRRAQARTEAGTPTVVTNDRGRPHLRRVPLLSPWPRGKGGRLIGDEKKAVVVNRKLSDALAAEIRGAHSHGALQVNLAVRYGVSTTLINGVVHRRRWA